MGQNLYELVALGARYAFTALMVLIVLRAWRLTIVDSRRAQTLRRMSPETGLSGELIVMEGDGKARRGMRYPVIREGMIGTSRRADIRVRHSSVRRRHAYFQLTPEGLSVRAHAGAPMRLGRGRPVREAVLKDGDFIDIGRVRLMLVLTESPDAAHPERPVRPERPSRPERPMRPSRPNRRDRGPEGDWDDVAPDPGELFSAHPLLTHVREDEGDADDDWFDVN